MTTSTETAPTVKTTSTRHGLRAPKGGCTVDGQAFQGGQFCRPFDADNPHELPTVEAKGSRYFVQPIDAGECGVAAVRLVKLASGEAYDLLRTHDGLIECSCPDYEFRHRGTASPCKHGRAAIVHGLLIPAVEPAPETDAEGAPDSWGPEADADVWELGPDAPDFDADRDRWTISDPTGEPVALAGDS
jgi:hypothetical protein